MTAFPKYDPDGQLSIGETGPDFTLSDVVSGKEYQFSKAAQGVPASVVCFSCNHCPWVIKYEARMIELGADYQKRGVPFFVISVNDVVKYPQDAPEEMRKRALAKGYPFPYLFDESQRSARDYGALVTPHFFLFDAERKLRYRGRLDDNAEQEPRPTKRYLKDALDAVLSGAADLASTPPAGCSIKWK